MNSQDKNTKDTSIPDVDTSKKLDEVVVADGIGGNNLKSSEAIDYIDEVAYLPENERIKVKSGSANVSSSNSAYDDLDDYVFKTKRVKKRVYTEPDPDDSIDEYLDSMYLNPKRSNKMSKNSKRRKKRKMKTWKKILIALVCVVLTIIIATIGTVSILNNMGKDELLKKNDYVEVELPKDAEQYENGKYVVTADGRKFQYNENITTILCMGVDRRDLGNNDIIGQGGSADALFLIALDTSNGKTKMINISRDTMSDISIYSTTGSYVGTEKQQICLAYSYGDGYESSCLNQVQAVSQLFYNIPINSYLSLDLSGIGPINDSVGGVTVVSPETIGAFIEGETYHLVGNQAEEFVRQRTLTTVNANSMRMDRQKIYIQEFSKILMEKTKNDIKTPLNLFETASPYICTNLNASKITYLGLNAIRGQYNSGSMEIKKIDGKAKKGEKYAEFYIDEEKFFETFLDVFYLPVE